LTIDAAIAVVVAPKIMGTAASSITTAT